ncbi:hypothetical protein ACFYSC_19970 [Streptosporangium sp. NPDC004379]|uniref:hypothetical protein n=1 Tax=Streptosporangium sp. NPDC004379 TaxID=3366189 RepID=UPI00367980E2
MTLIALQSAVRAGLDSMYENPLLPSQLDGEIASARRMLLGIALILAVEAAVLAVSGGRLNRRSTVGGLVLCTAVGTAYLFTLVLALLSTYVILFYFALDVVLGSLFPGWYFPVLIAIAVMAVTALAVWLSAAVRRFPAS